MEALLKDAGLREGRLHDARHTAARVLLILRQPTPTVMSLMGWSSESMAARYQHGTDTLRNQVASQVGELIWKPIAEPSDQDPVVVSRGSLAAMLTAAVDCAECHHDPSRRTDQLLAAIADVRSALAGAPRGTANETTRWPDA